MQNETLIRWGRQLDMDGGGGSLTAEVVSQLEKV